MLVDARYPEPGYWVDCTIHVAKFLEQSAGRWYTGAYALYRPPWEPW
jgi:hypothetical protein